MSNNKSKVDELKFELANFYEEYPNIETLIPRDIKTAYVKGYFNCALSAKRRGRVINLCDLCLLYVDEIYGYRENDGFLILSLQASGRHTNKRYFERFMYRSLEDLGWI